MLLRKKLEPQVEDWVQEGRATDSADGKQEELWNWANEWIGSRVATYAMDEAGDNYTVEERELGIENVRTGLRRKFDEDEDEDEDQDMEDVAVVQVTSARRSNFGVEYGMDRLRKDPSRKSRSVEEVLRFATSGVIPSEDLLGKR